MLRAVADIGSNTVKYGIYEINDSASLPERIYFESRTMKLISQIKNGEIDEGTLDKLTSLLCEYKKSALSKGAESFDVFATAWMRKVKNTDSIITRLKSALDCCIDILSGETEARLSQTAMSYELPDVTKGICVDMGGGSTEIIRFDGKKIINSKSLNFGCVVLRDNFISQKFLTEKENDNIRRYVESELNCLGFDITSDTLCLVGGSAKALEKLCSVVFSSNVTEQALNSLYNKLSESEENANKILNENVSERSDTAIPALSAFIEICEKVNPEKIRIVKSGTREGYLIDKYLIGEKK